MKQTSKSTRRVHSLLIEMPRGIKQIGLAVIDLMILPLMVMLAFSVRLGEPPSIPEDWWLLPLASLVTVVPLYFVGFYNVMVRYVGSEVLLPVLFSTAIGSMSLAASAYMMKTDPSFTPRSVFIIYFLLATAWLIASRSAVRIYARWVLGDSAGRQPVAIYGSGSAGRQVAAALEKDSHYRVIAFVDDDPSIQGTSILGVPVISRRRLEKRVNRDQVEAVLLAMPSVTRSQRMEVIRFLERLPVQVKSVPALPDIIAGTARIDEMRDIDIEDLLGRDQVPPDTELLRTAVTDKCVLVTGAGGSIGSELARQVAGLGPSRLVILDASEYALYRIEHQLRDLCSAKGIELRCVLESVTQRPRIKALLSEYKVQTVYHAAAYKHVPIIEENEWVGFENNVMGTLVVAEEAALAGVERFILVSTDKAVRPTNVMGATKRVAEMVVQALADRGDVETLFSIVRFGNVLGSSGSVVPRFREQINNDGPVTVTHPEVVRYFMTIPEAAQLVIQAGAMARGGEVFVLDMGEPVRIQDLARTMIMMMGYTVRDDENPDGDIEIVFTGLRPGEKLYEELLIGEQCVGTRHPMILQAYEEKLSWEEILKATQRFAEASTEGDGEAIRRLLREYVTGYTPAVLESA